MSCFGQQDHREAEISVRDNGRGMGDPQGALGLRLVESLAGQLGGTLTPDDVPKGTLTTLTFPYPPFHRAPRAQY